MTSTSETLAMRPYRFWPIFGMAFLRTFFFSIYSLALPNYLIYVKDLSSQWVGAIGSVSAIAYIFGPIVGRQLTKKIGIKSTLLITQIVCVSMAVISIVTFNPIILLIVRSIDGFVGGFFWPNLLNLISSWEDHHKTEKKINFLKIFNNSWNFGLILGYIMGYFIVFFLKSDKTALIASVGFSVFLIPLALMMEKTEKFDLYEERAVIIQDMKIITRSPHDIDIIEEERDYITKEISKQNKPIHSTFLEENYYRVPLIVALGGILVYASSKSIFKFTIPYIFIDNGINSEWVYVVVLLQQSAQILGLNIITKFPKTRYGYYIGLGGLLSFTLIFFFNIPIYLIVIFNILVGGCVGLMQGVTQRVILDYSKAKNSTRYTMLSEVFIGISFGFMPLIAGFLTAINLQLNFKFLLGFLLILSVILISAFIRFNREESKREKTMEIPKKQKMDLL